MNGQDSLDGLTALVEAIEAAGGRARFAGPI